MSENNAKRNIRQNGRRVWIIVLILAIALLITLALLGSLLGKHLDGEGEVIPLLPSSDREAQGQGGEGVQTAGEPGLSLQGEQDPWEVSRVDLFKAAYTNERGEITVQSDDGGKLIAPGTSNRYEFSLKNTSGLTLDYSMKLDSVFTLLNREIPMQVRLRSGDRWILGGEDEWVRPAMLSGVTESGTVEEKEYATYTFEWRWPFEGEFDDTRLFNDLKDTQLGNAAVEQKVEFQLEIMVQSTLNTGAAPVVSPEPTPQPAPLPARGNGLGWLALLGLLLCLGLWLLLLLLWRTPVYVTGLLPGVGELCLGRKKDTLRPNGRFVFPKVTMGKHSLSLGPEQSRIKLRRRGKHPGLAFERKDDLLVISLGKGVRAIELYLTPAATVRLDNWAAIDKHHNVITPLGVRPPNEDKENTTPGGLHINGEGELELDVLAYAL